MAPTTTTTTSPQRDDGSTSPKRAAESGKTNPSFKRRRTALACTSCRNRKTRCNGDRPICSLCVELGLECNYEQPVNGNAKPQQPVEIDDRLKAIEDTLRILVDTRRPTRDSRPSTDDNFDRPPYASAVDGQNTVVIQDEDAIVPAPTEEYVNGLACIIDPDETATRFYGPSSNIAFLRKISEATTATWRIVDGAGQQPSDRLNQSLAFGAPSPFQKVSPFIPSAVDKPNFLVLPPDHHAARLIDFFFAEAGMLFPFVQKAYVLTTYNASRSRDFVGMTKSFLCLLNAIFAMATHVSSPGHESVSEAETYHARSSALFDLISPKFYCVETVQCLLLMSQYLQGAPKADDAWMVHGKAVRIALQLGLHFRPEMTLFTAVDIEVRKRTWYNCVILDRTLSMTFGRPPMIPNSYVVLDLPVNRSLDSIANLGLRALEQDDMQRKDTSCLFIATIQLYHIMGDILDSVYGQNLSQYAPHILPDVVEKIFHFDQVLAGWRRSLPPELKMKPWLRDSTPSKLWGDHEPVFAKLSAILHLRYLNVRTLSHRRMLVAAMKFFVGKDDGLITAEDEMQDFFMERVQHSLPIIRSCAVEIIDVVWRMSDLPSLLGAWWFLEYYTFNACLTLFGCLMVDFHDLKASTSNHLGPVDRVGGMRKIIASLQRGSEAIEKLTKESQTTKKVRMTLGKMLQMSQALVHIYANKPREGGDQSMNATDAATSGPGTTSHQRHGSLDMVPALEGAVYPQPEGGFDVANFNFGAQGEFDVFAGLDGWDGGLGTLMAA